MKAQLAILTLVLAAISTNARAADAVCAFEVSAQFVESAPKDRFSFTNASAGGWQVAQIRLDLAPSQGRLVFDTMPGGRGVEVFQPFEKAAGAATLRETPNLKDGDNSLILNFAHFAPGQDYTFTIDVDDTAKASQLGQIRVAGGEIDGAELHIVLRGSDGDTSQHKARFGADARAKLVGENGC